MTGVTQRVPYPVLPDHTPYTIHIVSLSIQYVYSMSIVCLYSLQSVVFIYSNQSVYSLQQQSSIYLVCVLRMYGMPNNSSPCRLGHAPPQPRGAGVVVDLLGLHARESVVATRYTSPSRLYHVLHMPSLNNNVDAPYMRLIYYP